MGRMRVDPPTATVLLRWLDELRLVHAARIPPIDDAVASGWGILMAQRSRPGADALIASTAQVHNKIIVTRNIAAFDDTGVTVLDPWAMMR